MKTRVAMIFGGKSVEHEVSVISGIQAILSMDLEKYDVTPVYMTKTNEMYVGEGIADISEYKNIDALLFKINKLKNKDKFYEFCFLCIFDLKIKMNIID